MKIVVPEVQLNDELMNDEIRRRENNRSDEKENIPNERHSAYQKENEGNLGNNTRARSKKHCKTSKQANDTKNSRTNQNQEQDTRQAYGSYESYRRQIQTDETTKNINHLDKFQQHPLTNNLQKSNKHLSNTTLTTSTADNLTKPHIIQATTSYRTSIKSNDVSRAINLTALNSNNISAVKSTDFSAFIDLSKACDNVLVNELVKVVKRNAVLVVWNLSANCYRTKVQFRQVPGLVNWMQNSVQWDSDGFQEEYASVIGMLLS
ncbi:hypothetical protein WDU94_005893 [Cyamophila willieti]